MKKVLASTADIHAIEIFKMKKITIVMIPNKEISWTNLNKLYDAIIETEIKKKNARN